jgi:hypothetical protein
MTKLQDAAIIVMSKIGAILIGLSISHLYSAYRLISFEKLSQRQIAQTKFDVQIEAGSIPRDLLNKFAEYFLRVSLQF